MARRKGIPHRRKMGRYIRGNIDTTVPLGTLAAKDLLIFAVTGTVNERTLLTSIVCTWSQRAMTAVIDAGPIQFGVAHGDYASAEVEAWLETAGSWDEGDKIAQEIGRRKIRSIGTFTVPSTVASAVVFNDGRPKRTKLNWILNQGQTINIWVYNQGSVAISGATGADVNALGHANLFPK